MATLMQKDVLLEAASVAYLMPNVLSEEMKRDIKKMGLIKQDILLKDPKDIDMDKTMSLIRSIRNKYEAI